MYNSACDWSSVVIEPERRSNDATGPCSVNSCFGLLTNGVGLHEPNPTEDSANAVGEALSPRWTTPVVSSCEPQLIGTRRPHVSHHSYSNRGIIYCSRCWFWTSCEGYKLARQRQQHPSVHGRRIRNNILNNKALGGGAWLRHRLLFLDGLVFRID